MSIAYGILTVVAVLLLVGYVTLLKKKEPWLLFLFCCVPVVNLGYLLLSLAPTKTFAFAANYFAYFGSVFLILCMFMVIVRLCGYTYRRRTALSLLALALVMFAIVCSPWYYNHTATVFEAGKGLVDREYGPLHKLYAVYLAGYFVAMIVAIIRAVRVRQVASYKYAVLMTGIVLGNITFWLVEQFIRWDFEFLAVSYLFSELILLGLYWMMQDYVHVDSLVQEDKVAVLMNRLPQDLVLHPREQEILTAILDNKKRKDIAAEMNLSENTIKTYTRNLYKKLGVTSREELYQLI